MFSHQSMCMFLKQKKNFGREPNSDKAVSTAGMYSVREQSQ